ncbi:peptidase domain-containing ABC transporter [Olivibacter jilunii]|uniref:peptidase domain-containing ABC transporter n=1 Tax=Olivibacter jilunii TaxID=985016 RepID=UPI003F159EF5
MLRKLKFRFYKQPDAMDCGPTCLQMVATYYKSFIRLNDLRDSCFKSNQGIGLADLSNAATQFGFRNRVVKLNVSVLQNRVCLPCILHWQGNHFVVLYKTDKRYLYVADPAVGKMRFALREFCEKWANPALPRDEGYALLLEPGADFVARKDRIKTEGFFPLLWPQLRRYPFRAITVLLTLLLGCVALLCIPFFTQAIVDKGIAQNSSRMVYLFAMAQAALLLGRILMDIIRAQLLFFLGSSLSLSLLNTFLIKLMKLPLTYFEARHIGDNVQRLMDHQKMEEFVTRSVINLVLSVITMLVFGTVLLFYSPYLFSVFFIGSIIVFAWTLSWRRRRKELDYALFQQASANQNLLIETISAVGEIKLTGYQEAKVNSWISRQEQIYGTKLQSLKLDQRILSGAQIFNECKNLLITCLAANLVIDGEMTMGMMLSATYIAGQLNTPVLQLAEFIRSAQNARFTLTRMQEIEAEREEDSDVPRRPDNARNVQPIHVNGLAFRYGGPGSPLVLNHLSITFPAGKTTAIVGMSGSGKTTLIKLLLKFYEAQQGSILIGGTDLQSLHAEDWRASCGVVMQGGYIFSDTLAANIVTSLERDEQWLSYAIRMANLQELVETLPAGLETRVGRDGVGLSEGQKQRILIARMIYRKPSFIFLDEATNALDAHNEKTIVQNLQSFFEGKTVVVVAHRLSTVRNADQIVVMEKGCLMETGSHDELLQRKGFYFQLVKNQLELDG